MNEDRPNSNMQGGMILQPSAVHFFAIAFALWAGVVGWMGQRIIGQFDTAQAQLNQFIVSNERRITTIEAYQKTQDERDQEQQAQISHLTVNQDFVLKALRESSR